MVVFVISHGLSSTSYLLAVAIRLYFQNQLRPLKIIIIENHGASSGQGLAMKNSTLHDLQPWCGVNMLNNYRFVNNNFIVGVMLNQFLLQNRRDFSIWSLDSIKFLPSHTATCFNMDNPISSQQERIEASLSDNPVGIGMIYHPILLINGLRRLVFTWESNISVVSLHNGRSMDQFVREVSLDNPGQRVVVIDAGPVYTPRSDGGHRDYLINSNLSEVRYANQSNPLRISHPPSFAVLWLPKLLPESPQSKNIVAKVSSTALIATCQVTTISLQSPACLMAPDEAISELNIFHALKACDVALGAIHALLISEPMVSRF